MSRAELARDLDAISRHLVLLAALVENLAHSLRTPQDDSAAEVDPDAAPAVASATTGKGNGTAARRARTPGDLQAHPRRGSDMDMDMDMDMEASR